MDARAQRKALFRSKLKENSQTGEKRIDSPLVRYNQDDQPVCRVCNVTLKSESLWPAHQVSRKHHEAIENVKAAAARQSTSNNSHLEKQQNLQAPRVSSTLPAELFDSQDAKRQKTEHVNKGNGLACGSSSKLKEMDQIKPAVNLVNSSKHMGGCDVMDDKSVLSGSFADKGTDDVRNARLQSQVSKHRNKLEAKKPTGALPMDFFDKIDPNGDSQAEQFSKELEKTNVVQLKTVQGALPAGFFDNKDADLRARGIEPVKVDIGDAYKEFEKEIQKDLQGVDDRLEEEEIDAAEVTEVIESLEQKAYRERVEMVKKKLIEAKESRLARLQRSPEFKGKDFSESSSDESDADEDFAVDWRAKRL